MNNLIEAVNNDGILFLSEILSDQYPSEEEIIVSKYEKALRLKFEKYPELTFTESGKNSLAKCKEANVRLLNCSHKF
ncbi:MAG: hypothetical protein MUW56_22405 [Chryseobacterium sp.]|uniref:hypothetical protein n=1 Tax=Chryseobacterium sp. TaxID=1871047 RepID=UPI0025C5B80A|nr:hypothetical protein [Chryseobacterium sp.]MCJ7936307.1 hypothetical protein [Chryseobacterium sp.]